MLERNLITSLLLYESIRTTRKRAKVVQPVIDKLIHYAKSHPPHVAIRYANRILTDKNASRKIMEVYCVRYAERSSGLSRMTPVGSRRGDGAELVDLTLIDAVIGAHEEEKKTTSKKTKSSETSAPKSETQAAKKPAKKSSSKKAS